MKIEQIYTGCLSQGTYYIESENEVVIIDPLRDIDTYINKARKTGAKIKYILETHFHADFVSGHIDLAKATGATIVYGPMAQPKFDAHIAKDGEFLNVGKIKIEVLHTPGHTMESTCYLLFDEFGKEDSIFTGDTLFIGDVGRPDLAVNSDLTVDQLAGHLYDSLRSKIMNLPDYITVFPAHGAGSACGKNISKETFDTLGRQKQVNYALETKLSKGAFIKIVTNNIPKAPQYFPSNVMLNKEGGQRGINDVLKRGTNGLSVNEFEALANETRALILDARNADVFAKGFIPGSINIGIDGSFAPWVGALITDIKQVILVIADNYREEEVVMRLARVGYDNTLGYLKGGFAAWKKSGRTVDTIESITAYEFESRAKSEFLNVVDVRNESEFNSEHLENVEHIPLDAINSSMEKFSRNKIYYLHCAGGYRSMIAASILKARDYDNIVNIEGGFKAISYTSLPKTAFICPSTNK